MKWALRDEEALPQADWLLTDMLHGALRPAVPTLFDYEIANVLKVAVSRNRLTPTQAATLLDQFAQYPIRRWGFETFGSQTLQLALQFNRSAYDSAYIALAQSLGVWLYTGDKRLFNAVNPALPEVKWVGDYALAKLP